MPDAARKSSADQPVSPHFQPFLLRSKRCPRASIRRAFKARIPTGESGMACRKARPNFRSAPFVSHPRALALNGEARKERSPLPKSRLLHAAFSSSRTPRENRPPISHSFCVYALSCASIRRAFKARIPTGESGMACRKARSNFRAAFPPLILTSERLQSHPPRSHLKPFTPRCTLFTKPAGARILPAISLYAPPPPLPAIAIDADTPLALQ